jgi:hypothetical protein
MVPVGLAVGFMVFRMNRTVEDVDAAMHQPTANAAGAQDPGVPLRVPNLRAVDPVDIIRQARAEACRRQPNCALTYAFIGGVAAGTIDTTGNSANVLLTVAFRATDPTKPPGQDIIDAGFNIRVRSGKLYLDDGAGGSRPNPSWPDPNCTFSNAWRAAVASGVASNAIVDIYYRDGFGKSAERKVVWSVSVNGHPELSRQIDSATCEILK